MEERRLLRASLSLFYGLSILTLALAEQVGGCRKRPQFELLIEDEEIQCLSDSLSTEVGKDIAYWEQLIDNRGHII